MRRAIVVLAVVLAAPAPAVAAITLSAEPTTPRWGTNVTLSGVTTPGESVQLFLNGLAYPGAVVTADGVGRFGFVLPATHPGSYDARTSADTSAPVNLKLRPVLKRRITGLHYPGNRLYFKGRLYPRHAGSLTLKVGRLYRHVRLRSGRFATRLPTASPGRHLAKLVIHAHPGYRGFTALKRYRIFAPYLSPGSAGTAVLALERRLAALHHVLHGPPSRYYGTDTYEAVLAFQKVHGMTRTGRVSPTVWKALGKAHVPKARVSVGNHVEVSKTHQVLYEVRNGKVALIVHVSTGATGNTPVGRFHIYSKVPGLNSHGMYYSNFFTGAFAIHGYASVPPWPASHGCVRTPMWYAPGFYARWPIGTPVYVFA